MCRWDPRAHRVSCKRISETPELRPRRAVAALPWMAVHLRAGAEGRKGRRNPLAVKAKRDKH